MIKNFVKTRQVLIQKAKEFGIDCEKVFVASSGGVDSSLVVAILCKAFGADNVIGLYRDIKSNPKHKADVIKLQNIFEFKLICLDANPIYNLLVADLKKQFQNLNLDWYDEFDERATENGFTNAYSSLKSRFNTFASGFISKAIDSGRGRIFGTGNGEEDEFLRYFDKYGDGAVDNNLLLGFNKAEVRQLALFMGVPKSIVYKKPTADLEANGNKHNDESQLSAWARQLGYDIKISYGSSDGKISGNIAWAWKEDIERGVIKGKNKEMPINRLKACYGYSQKRIEIILFLREIEKTTRHKIEPIPGMSRLKMLKLGLVE